MGPYKMEAGGLRVRGDVTAEAEVGMMRPSAKERRPPLEAGKRKGQILP